MQKEIYFFESIADFDKFADELCSQSSDLEFEVEIFVSRFETQNVIKKEKQLIYTTDMSSLSTKLLINGYRIFIKHIGQDFVEVKIGQQFQQEPNIFEVRVSQSIENMYKSNCFRR